MAQGRKRTKPKNKAEVKKFWNFVANQEGNTAELLLYGEISEYSWYGDEITPEVFNNDLKAIGAVDEITVRINSGGGDVFAAVAIYTRLKEHKAKVAVKIDGWCASAATIIAMAGDTIEISVGGIFMIHDPMAGLLGYYNVEELNKISKELETIKQSIVNCYMTVTEMSEDEIKNLMTEEKWFTAEEAVEAGFCTSVMFGEVETTVENAEKIIVNSVEINLEGYRTVPKGLLGYTNSLNNNTNVKNDKEENEMTLEELKQKHPELVNAIRTEATTGNGAATTEAVDAERARIKAIDEITLPGFEDMATKAKYEQPISAEAFAMQIIAEQKKQGQTFLNDREEDVQESGVKDVTPVSNKGFKKNEEEDPFGDIIDSMYPKTN